MEQTPTLVQKPQLTGPIDLIKQAWQFFAKIPWQFAKVMLVPYVVLILMGLALSLYSQNQLAGFFVILLLWFIVILLINLFMHIALLLLIKNPSPEIKLIDLYKGAVPWTAGFVFVSFLAAMSELGGMFLFVIPGIIFAIWFIFTTVVLIFENQRGWQALRRSRELVQEYWWAVLGRLLVLGLFILLLAIIGSILTAVARVISAEPFHTILRWLAELYGYLLPFLYTPLSLIFLVFIYQELVKIKGASKLMAWSKGKKAALTAALFIPLILSVAGAAWFVVKQSSYNSSFPAWQEGSWPSQDWPGILPGSDNQEPV